MSRRSATKRLSRNSPKILQSAYYPRERSGRNLNRPVKEKESNKYLEVILGLVLGTVSIVFGFSLTALSYNGAVSIPLLVYIGIFLIVMGAIAVVASIAVLRGGKTGLKS
jgi:hypothetical protein